MSTIILVPGFWLGAWSWADVAEQLRTQGHQVQALTLPGLDPQDPKRLDTTLELQAQAIIDTVPAGETAVLVAHSGGGAAAYLATDMASSRFRQVIYVDSAPLPDGYVLNPQLGVDSREYPLPNWADLEAEGNSLAGLDERMLERFAERAVSEPSRVAGAPLRLSDDTARYQLPTTVICCTFSADVVRQLRDEGELPMFAELAQIDAQYVDLPTGHWPMWSRPDDLATTISDIVEASPAQSG